MEAGRNRSRAYARREMARLALAGAARYLSWTNVSQCTACPAYRRGPCPAARRILQMREGRRQPCGKLMAAPDELVERSGCITPIR